MRVDVRDGPLRSRGVPGVGLGRKSPENRSESLQPDCLQAPSPRRPWTRLRHAPGWWSRVPAPSGPLFGCREMALEFVCGANFSWTWICGAGPGDIGGPGGRLRPEIQGKPGRKSPARLPSCTHVKEKTATGLDPGHRWSKKSDRSSKPKCGAGAHFRTVRTPRGFAPPLLATARGRLAPPNPGFFFSICPPPC